MIYLITSLKLSSGQYVEEELKGIGRKSITHLFQLFATSSEDAVLELELSSAGRKILIKRYGGNLQIITEE